ncbi:isochorismate synthase [Brenneria izadpanahii]|uniref:isochorismate synthase n=1 Tax=Brenneria izadpanahii TaxID=2722756 RepID=A0ABX7UVZ9_9GAMM|nr:isochorismate synthase [Brenneria izadpanahii]QTF08742.1 isochorismate synthase [Brenneria izadpanahii]
MNELATEFSGDGPPGCDESASFSYRSAHRCIDASGIFERISRPAMLKNADDRAFWLHIKQAMNRAKQAGVEAPIVVGAIPFDASQPSCLYIPKEYQFISASTADAKTLNSIDKINSIISIKNIPEAPQFKSAVASALNYFQNGEIRKVVLSRMVEIELEQKIDRQNIINNLRLRNPGGYHFSLPLPDGGILLGASPELLIRKEGRFIHSQPLAGSAPRHSDSRQDKTNASQLLDSEKDRHEHRIVVDDIRQHLSSLCRDLTLPETPSLLSTDTMWHLATAIRGELAQAETSVIQLACLLHPTPALCGTPTAAARDLIALLEPYDRGVFSGIVGWCDANGDGEWAIAIRCGIVQRRLVRFFAGAGIVAGSEPHKEWAEVSGKLGTMLRAFGLHTEDI